MINIENRLEVFWDDFLVDTEKTTAERRLGHLTRKEPVLVHDMPWEGDGSNSHNLERDGSAYKLFHSASNSTHENGSLDKTSQLRFCFCESSDGLYWTRPDLGVCEFKGATDNNIVMDQKKLDEYNISPGYTMMIDDNPDRVVRERYKLLGVHFKASETKEPVEGVLQSYEGALRSFVSDDGVHFRFLGTIVENDLCDSTNVAFWNPLLGKYFCFFRSHHKPGDFGADSKVAMDFGAVRDIRVTESKDFIHWSESKLLAYGDCEEVPLYTNCVSIYPRAPHIMVGFPTRYIERKEWTDNFTRLCGAEKRKIRCTEDEMRSGLALTDCIFMCSREGYEWKRFDEAFITPGPENGRNWVYGDGYPCNGMIETPSDNIGADDEISMFMLENAWMGIPVVLRRYTIRREGFAFFHAGITPRKVVTKEFSFTGEHLQINFATSARGYMTITLHNIETGGTLASGELFGDKTDRVVDFNGDVSSFSGYPVVLEFTLCDACLYAFQFE